jgi:peptide chain release factor 1
VKRITLTKKDFRIEYFRSSGPGGQNVNKRSTACRITHTESGLATSCQVHKSQLQNKKEAFKKLANLLKVYYNRDKGIKERYAAGKGTTRTYNEPNDRVVDHVTKKKYSYHHTVGKGDISEIIEDRVKHRIGNES